MAHTLTQAQALTQGAACIQASQALAHYCANLQTLANALAGARMDDVPTLQAIVDASALALKHTLAKAGVSMPLTGAGMAVAEGKGTKVQATPAPAQYLPPAGDVACMYVRDGRYVTAALAGGAYIGRTGIRRIMQARIREGGGKWDQTHRAYVFADAATAQAFVKSADPTVTAAQWEAYRQAAAEKAQRKAAGK